MITAEALRASAPMVKSRRVICKETLRWSRQLAPPTSLHPNAYWCPECGNRGPACQAQSPRARLFDSPGRPRLSLLHRGTETCQGVTQGVIGDVAEGGSD